MKTYVSIAVLMLICMFCPAVAVAQPPAPPEGLRSEMAGEWGKAIEIYQRILETEPGRVDLWVRISDIQARLSNPEGAAVALAEAARLAPDDADIHFRWLPMMPTSISGCRRHMPPAISRSLRFPLSNVASSLSPTISNISGPEPNWPTGRATPRRQPKATIGS